MNDDGGAENALADAVGQSRAGKKRFQAASERKQASFGKKEGSHAEFPAPRDFINPTSCRRSRMVAAMAAETASAAASNAAE